MKTSNKRKLSSLREIKVRKAEIKQELKVNEHLLGSTLRLDNLFSIERAAPANYRRTQPGRHASRPDRDWKIILFNWVLNYAKNRFFR